ncbi:MAG: hypothetical protein H7841_15895 [Magnetospirillum sp. WYHS-4]
MTIVAPPPPPLPLPATAAPLPALAVQGPPVALLALATGTRLEALLLAQDSKGLAQLQAPFGTFELPVPFALPKGAALAFSVQQHQGRVLLQLLTMNGKPAAQALAHPPGLQGAAMPQGQPSGRVPLAAGGPGGLPFVSLSTGSPLTATLLQPGRGMAPPQQEATEAVPNPALRAMVSARQAFTNAKSQLETLVDNAFGRPASPPSQAPQASPSSAALPARLVPLPAGTQVTVVLTAVQTPAGGSPPAPSPGGGAPLPAPGQTLPGTVTGTTAAGWPIVQTPAGALALETKVPVPIGSTVTLEIKGAPLPRSLLPGEMLPLPRAEALTAQDWPALADAVAVLREASPEAARQVLSQSVPRLDSNLAAGMLLFLTALKGGDIKGWLGEGPLRVLERARPGVAARLKEDFGDRSKLSEEKTSDGWKVMAIPLQNGQALEQMRMMTRQHPEDEPESEGGGGTRFVVEVALSQTGRVQLDGLVFKGNKRLDLIVRTEGPLPGAMRDDIRSLFKEAAEVTGIQGGVTFQAQPPLFVDVALDKTSAGSRGVVV